MRATPRTALATAGTIIAAVGVYSGDAIQVTSDANSFLTSRYSPGSEYRDENDGVFSRAKVLARRSGSSVDTLVTAHGIIMTLVFVAGYPIGAIISRFVSRWFIHAGWQLLVYCGMWAGFGVAIVVSRRFGLFFTTPHTRLGVFVVSLQGIQPILGFLHHMYYVKNRRRGIISYIHIWYGRSLMIIGVVNGGLGIKYARELGLVSRTESWHLEVGYIVVAAIVAAAYLGSIAFSYARTRQRDTRANVSRKV